jgi:two-component system, OmpR family, response regulator TctD
MHVLLIAECEDTARWLARALGETGYEFSSTGPDASTDGQDSHDLIVVYGRSSVTDEVALVTRLRRASRVMPILVLSPGRGALARTLHLNAGADDCLSLPFDPCEIRARVRALARRNRRDMFHLGRFAWDWEHRQGEIDRVPLALSLSETVLLEALLKAHNRIVPMTVLARRIDATGGREIRNRLYVVMCRLRKKLLGADLKIRSASGRGYSISLFARSSTVGG